MDKIKIEGQEIEMPAEIARDDTSLKNALSPYFPGAANAKFMRSEEKDGVITVTVVKQAGTKGAKVLRSEDKEGLTSVKLVELAGTEGVGDDSNMIAMSVEEHSQSHLQNYRMVDISGRLNFSRGGIAKTIIQILESGGGESTQFKTIFDRLRIRLQSPSVDPNARAGYNHSLIVFDELSCFTNAENLKAFLCSKDGEWIRSNLDLFLPESEEDQVLRKLIDAPEGLNPLMVLDQKLSSSPAMNQCSFETMLKRDAEISKALEIGEAEVSSMEKTFRSLVETKPQPAPMLTAGF